MAKETGKLIEENGLEALTEMLDLFEIVGKDPDAWRNFALKYKFIKKTTRIITPQLVKKHITQRYQADENGVWGHYDVEPYDLYYITLKNGRGQWVFSTKFTNLDINKWREKYG